MAASASTTRVLLITANIGSIFENPNVMLKIWTKEFLNTVTRLDPYFIALHCQEVGGKNYEESMKHVDFFVSLLMSSKELRIFNRAQVFLDEEFTSAENFTALGNFYFIHEDIKDVSLWDFKELQFVPVTNTVIHSGSIENVTTKEKSKFPQEFFPECKWSRKGFLRTRWKLNGTVFDLVNIHLFHDASNFTAMESHPSVYSIMRQKALEYTLERFRDYAFGCAPFFLFGDFNFRTDTKAVIMKLVEGLDLVKDDVIKDELVLQYADSSNEVVLKLGKKEFCHLDHQNAFVSKAGSWLKDFDHELKSFEGQLFEFPIHFQPSYPFEENEEEGMNYMKTRCPAWCDRVVLSSGAKLLLDEKVFDEDCFGFEYDLIGKTTCMGDHKPVYLKLDITNHAGTVLQCECKLNRVSPESQIIPPHAFSGVDTDECCIPVDIPDFQPSTTVLGQVADAHPPTPAFSALIPLSAPVTTLCPSSSSPVAYTTAFSSPPHLINNRGDVVSPKTSSSFSCGSFLRKKIGDNNNKMTSSSSWSSCVCKTTNKWKLPVLVQRAWKQNGHRRVRLKSNASVDTSLQRYQSHHSSSDEDWFEEIAEDEVHKGQRDDSPVDDGGNKTETVLEPFSTCSLSKEEEGCLRVSDDNSSSTQATTSQPTVTNRLQWCSFTIRKICDKRSSLTASTKISRREKLSKNSCRIV